MKMSMAMTRADELRPNALSEEQKAAWLYDLDSQIAKMMGLPVPGNDWPADRELLMPAPHEEIYPLYLVCKIDYYNQETELYLNDREIYSQALAEAQARWRRESRPARREGWRVM